MATNQDGSTAGSADKMERSERGTRQGQTPFQGVLENILDGFLALDRDFRCTYVNKAAAAFLSTTPDAVVGHVIWEAFPPARYPQLHAEITRAAEQQVHVKFQEYCEKCGHWFEWHCYPADDRLAIFVEDISARKQAEEQIAQSEQHYRLLFETMPQGVVYQDTEGRIISMNPAAERILGRTSAELLGRSSVDEEYHTRREDGSPFPAAEHPSMVALRTGQEVHNVVMGVFNPREQAYRWINITAVPLVRPGEHKPYQVYTHFADITELRQAVRALQYSERRFRKLFEADPMGVFITRPDGTFLDCNEAMAKILGYDTREEVLQHRSSDFYVDPEFRAEAIRVLQTKGVYLGREGRVWRKDGSIAHLLGAAVLLKDEETGEPFIQGVAVDVTERKRMEEALRQSEERYRKLFEANLAGVYITKLDGTIVDFNTAMMKMLGYDSREELLQKRSTDLYVNPEFRKELVRLIQQEGVVVGKEALLQRKDGSVLYAHGAAALLRDDATGELYIQGVVIDITERKRAEEALRASEERYRKLFEANMAGVYLAKLDGTILDFNEAMMKMLGYDSREEVLSHRVPDFYVDPEVRLELLRLLKRDGILQGKEVLLRKKDGSPLYALGSAALLTDKRTGEPYILGVALDVTDRRKAEEELHFTEARFRAVFEQTPLSIQILSLEGRTTEINQAWEQLWGVTGLSYDLKDWNILHDRQIEAMGILPYIQRGFAGEATETPVVLYDPAQAGYPGRPRWLKAYIYPIKDETGRILQVVVTHVDVTELVKTEKALARSVKDLEFLSISALRYLEAMPSRELLQYTARQLQAIAGRAIVVVSEYDPGTNQTTVRGVAGPGDKLEKLPRLLGRDPVGLVFTVAEGTLERALPGRLELVKGGVHELTFYQMPVPLATAIEQELDLGEIYAMPFALGEDFMGTVAVGTDRIEGLQNRELMEAIVNHAALALKRTRTEEALRDLTATLETQVAQRTAELEHRAQQLQKLALELSETEDRERERLAEILHDDLQQTLAAAKFHLGLVRHRSEADPPMRQMIEQINKLLVEAIGKSRNLSHELSPLGLAHRDLGETFEWLAQQIQAKHGLTIHLDVRERIEPALEPIRGILYKAAQEMLFNVVKHAGVREATLRLRRRGGSICLSVSDKGRGFDLEESGRTAGSGLRSIRERISLLGGRMMVRSTTGKGSTFLVTVPDAPPRQAAQAEVPTAEEVVREVTPPRERAAGAEKHVLRVLLADDHKIVREGIESILEGEPDIEIVGQAGDGREAVELANQLEPDVVVMDVSLPTLPGDEATRRIKRGLPQTRVVALSVHDEAWVKRRMSKAGAAAYLLKTAPSEELLAAIRGQEPDAEPVASSA